MESVRWFWLSVYHALQHISVGFFSLQVFWQPWPGLPGRDGSTNSHLPVQERSSHLWDVQVSQEVFQLWYKLSLKSKLHMTLPKSPGPVWARASVPSADKRWLEGRLTWRHSSGRSFTKGTVDTGNWFPFQKLLIKQEKVANLWESSQFYIKIGWVGIFNII